MEIFIASDHAGYELKKEIVSFLGKNKNYNIVDIGTSSPVSSVNYSSYGIELGKSVSSHKNSFGIAICGTGIGISIAANKVKGIRAALCHSVEYAKLSRMHNNANIIALGGRFLESNEAKKIVEVFLSTEFEKGRHETRIKEIDEY